MSKEKGVLLTWSRCGTSVFLKELESNIKEIDGGYTQSVKPKYEPAPPGWSTKYIGDSCFSCYDLCPSCTIDSDKVFSEFWKSASIISI